MDGTQKTMELLIASERMADQILQNRQECVALDKRRQETRVAIRDLTKCDDKKTWITVGSLLVKMSKERALDLLMKEQKSIDVEINKLQSDQKVLVSQHRDLEFLDQYKGHHLEPLSRDEIAAFRSNLPGF